MAISRRLFLQGASMALMSRTASTQTLDVPEVIWPSDDAIGSISAQTNELAAMLSLPRVKILVRQGVHLVNRALVSSASMLEVRGEGTNTGLVFLDKDSGGLRVVSAEACSISNLSLAWQGSGRPKRSHYGAGLLCVRCTAPSVNDVSIDRAPGAGLHFAECVAPSARRISITNTGADGIHFANCQDAFLADSECISTGDDAIAVVDYKKKSKSSGFVISGCSVVDSFSRGIAIVGGSEGECSDCTIDGTASNGVHVEQDDHYKTRHPRAVIFSRISIRNVGKVTPHRGNQFGVSVLRADEVQLSDVSVIGGASVGICVVSSTGVAISDAVVDRTSAENVRLIESSVSINGAALINANRVQFRAANCPSINGIGIRLNNVSGRIPRALVVLYGESQGALQFLGVERREIVNNTRNRSVFVSVE